MEAPHRRRLRHLHSQLEATGAAGLLTLLRSLIGLKDHNGGEHNDNSSSEAPTTAGTAAQKLDGAVAVADEILADHARWRQEQANAQPIRPRPSRRDDDDDTAARLTKADEILAAHARWRHEKETIAVTTITQEDWAGSPSDTDYTDLAHANRVRAMAFHANPDRKLPTLVMEFNEDGERVPREPSTYSDTPDSRGADFLHCCGFGELSSRHCACRVQVGWAASTTADSSTSRTADARIPHRSQLGGYWPAAAPRSRWPAKRAVAPRQASRCRCCSRRDDGVHCDDS